MQESDSNNDEGSWKSVHATAAAKAYEAAGAAAGVAGAAAGVAGAAAGVAAAAAAAAANTAAGAAAGVANAAAGTVLGVASAAAERVQYPMLNRMGTRAAVYELFSALPSRYRVLSWLKAWSDEFGPRQLLGYLWPAKGKSRMAAGGRFGQGSPGARSAAKARVICAIALLILAKMFIVRVPLLFKRCVDSLVPLGAAHTGAPGDISPALWMVLYVVCRALYTVLQELRYMLFAPVAQNAQRRFMRDAFGHLQALDAAYFVSQSTGELSRVFARGVRGMELLLRLIIFNVFPTAVEAVLVMSLLGRRYGPSFSIATLTTIAAFVGWSYYCVERRVRLLVQLNKQDNSISTKFMNAMLNNEAVRSFAREGHEIKQYDTLLSKVEALNVKDVKTISSLNVGQALIFCAGLGSMLTLCARRVVSGTVLPLTGSPLTAGDVVAIHAMLLQLQSPLNALAFTYQEIRQALTDMKQLLLQLKRTTKVASAPDAPALTVPHGTIRFENISFGYSRVKAAEGAGTLRGVSFEIPAGKKTAIVGSSGSGKSTILKLITRTYDPQAGRVLIDGQDVRNVSLTSLRQQLGLVPQDTILFDETILYNLRYGDLDAGEQKLVEVATRVGLDKTAAKLPNGFYSRVGERGLALSGGERQRVAIARALLKDPPVLLSDEPTSALDSITEVEIDKLLHDSEDGRTSIVVAHKLRLIQVCPPSTLRPSVLIHVPKISFLSSLLPSSCFLLRPCCPWFVRWM